MSGAVGRLLAPASVAVVGASRSVGGPSHYLLEALREYGYRGDVHLVNPGGHEIGGRVSLRSVDDLPPSVDLALVMVPAVAVVDAVARCAERGIAGAVVYSAGFGDDRDPAGGLRQEALAEVARRTGIRVVGPNSQGFLNLVELVPASFSPSISRAAVVSALGGDGEPVDARGNVAVLAQSGGLGYSLFNRGVSRGVRFSHVISTGNEVDLEMQDFLDYLLDDPSTHVVLMYLEGLKDPSRFQELARRAAETGTQLVVAKVGASPAGRRAALSHTGHVAGDDAAYDAVFRRHGVHRVHDPDEVLDVALALSSCPRPSGGRVAVVSASGGSGVWLADALSSLGLELPELDATTRKRLEGMLPSFASVANPVDISGAASVGPTEVLAALADDPQIDALLLATTLARPERIESERSALQALVAETGKPALVYSYTEPSTLAWHVLQQLRLPLYTSIAGCARGLAALVRASTQRDTDDLVPSGLDSSEARRLVATAEAAVLSEHDAKRALRAFGIAVPREELATTADEAVAIAARMGGPVALKVQSSDVPHKVRAGGVALGLVTDDEVRHAFGQVTRSTAAHVPAARLDGVLVQEMAPPGLELLLGVENRSGLGPIVVLGVGGELVEVLRRTVSMPAPFGVRTARSLLRELGIEVVLGSSDQLAGLISSVSHFAALLEDLVEEMDLNPVLVERSTGTPWLVDALLVRKPAGETATGDATSTAHA